MVYKKYIKRGGKLYGPYYYESKRIGNKVVSNYVKREVAEEEEKPEPPPHKTISSINFNKKFLFIIPALLVLIVLMFTLKSFFPALTGKVALQISPSYEAGEKISGSMDLVLQKGELIPADSEIIISLQEQENTISLQQALIEYSNVGEYYLEERDLEGEGLGFGVPGEIIYYPEIEFTLLIYEQVGDEGGGDGGGQESEEPSEPEPRQPLGGEITGEAILERDTIQGFASADMPFVIDLNENEQAEILNAEIGGVEVDISLLILTQNGTQVVVSTNYTEIETGFGPEFVDAEKVNLTVNLQNFDILAESGELRAVLSYNDTEILTVSEEIEVEEPVARENVTTTGLLERPPEEPG
ncbi:MAG: hypothetical protein PVG65_05900, partial [Candidatus Thorarchaeota archaeon]